MPAASEKPAETSGEAPATPVTLTVRAAEKVKEIRVDFSELEFCNSSGFKAFIHWIQKVQSMPEASRYRIRFLSSPARKWQRTSLLALSCYAPGLVEIL